MTAPPEHGRANAAVIAAFADYWNVPQRAVRIVQGATNRRKVVAVEMRSEPLNSRSLSLLGDK